MVEYAGFRLEIEEIEIELDSIICARRYVIYRVDLYRCYVCGRYLGDNNRKEVRVPIGFETDKYVAEKLIEKMNKGE